MEIDITVDAGMQSCRRVGMYAAVHACICVYVHMYVCVYVCVYVYMCICVDGWTDGRTDGWRYIFLTCLYAYAHGTAYYIHDERPCVCVCVSLSLYICLCMFYRGSNASNARLEKVI